MPEELYGLVNSGGASFGSYETGANEYLIKVLKRRYKVFSGTSVGFFNLGHLAQYKTEDLEQGIDDLIALWLKVMTPDIHKRWFPLGKVHALWEQALYNSKPMREYLGARYDNKKVIASGNRLFAGLVSLETGKYHLVDENHPDPLSAFLASAAMPVMFLPQQVMLPDKTHKQWCSDGGIHSATPLRAALKAGCTHIDVVLTEPELIGEQTDFSNTLDVALRTLNILVHNVFILDLGWTLAENKLAAAGLSDKREVHLNIIRPSKPLPGDPLQFLPAHAKELMRLGYTDAEKLFVVREDG